MKKKQEPHRVSAENAETIWGWLQTRGGLAIWESVDLSDPGRSVTAPYKDEAGWIKPKPHWKFDERPARIITDPSEVLVEIVKEVKRFRVAVRRGSMGLSWKLTDVSTKKVRDACSKAGEHSMYVFDYDTQEAVILVPSEVTPLKVWVEKNVKVAHLGGKFLRAIRYAVQTDFYNEGVDVEGIYESREDAVLAAATIAEANYRDQRNFDEETKDELARLWAAQAYQQVLDMWQEVMSKSQDHLDFIYVIEVPVYSRP